MGKKQNEKLNNNIEIKVGQFYVLTWGRIPLLFFVGSVTPAVAVAALGSVWGLRY